MSLLAFVLIWQYKFLWIHSVASFLSQKLVIQFVSITISVARGTTHIFSCVAILKQTLKFHILNTDLEHVEYQLPYDRLPSSPFSLTTKYYKHPFQWPPQNTTIKRYPFHCLIAPCHHNGYLCYSSDGQTKCLKCQQQLISPPQNPKPTSCPLKMNTLNVRKKYPFLRISVWGCQHINSEWPPGSVVVVNFARGETSEIIDMVTTLQRYNVLPICVS